MQAIQKKLDTELDIIESLTKEYEKDNWKNTFIYRELHKAMKWAWIFFFVTPLVGFAIQRVIF